MFTGLNWEKIWIGKGCVLKQNVITKTWWKGEKKNQVNIVGCPIQQFTVTLSIYLEHNGKYKAPCIICLQLNSILQCRSAGAWYWKIILQVKIPVGVDVHPKLRNINLHNIAHSLISQNLRERMFVVYISLLIGTFLSFISRNFSLMQTTRKVNSHPRIVPCVNMWSVTFFFVFLFFFLCHLLNVGACICHIARPWRPSGVDCTNGGERRMNPNFIVSHATLIV